jgi:hypothetical protein
MPDLRPQLRDYYAKKSLSPAKVEEILARGRAASSGKESDEPRKVLRFPRLTGPALTKALAIAAVVAMLAAVASIWWSGRDSRLSVDAIPRGMVSFFAGKPDLHHAPQDKKSLKEWLVARGAPRDFQIPATLLPLESFACQVVNVQGRDLYLSCYWREQRPNRGDHELVHLLVGRKSDFRDAPASSQPQLKELEGWSFASWSEGDVIYTLATPAPMDRLRPFLARAPIREFFEVASLR